MNGAQPADAVWTAWAGMSIRIAWPRNTRHVRDHITDEGDRLFRDGGTPIRLRLIDAKPTTTGVLILTYVPAS